MDFETVDLPEILVAGLAVRTSNKLEQDPTTGVLAKTWERVSQKQYPGPVAATLTDYESDSTGMYAETIGHEISSVNDLLPQDVLTRVPAGTYAKCRVEGEMPQIVMEAWSKVWQAEKDKMLQRAYTTDLERYPEPGVVELYIAVT